MWRCVKKMTHRRLLFHSWSTCVAARLASIKNNSRGLRHLRWRRRRVSLKKPRATHATTCITPRREWILLRCAKQVCFGKRPLQSFSPMKICGNRRLQVCNCWTRNARRISAQVVSATRLDVWSWRWTKRNLSRRFQCAWWPREMLTPLCRRSFS